MHRIPFVVAVLAVAAACEPVGGRDCTLMAVSSVTLNVENEAGARISGSTATYSVDGGEPVACEALGGNGDFVCGWEVAGDLTITASAPGYQEASQTVTVEADECHVVTEELTLTLQEAECNDDAVLPSIRVTVVGSTGESLSDVWVAYTPEGAEDPNDCYETGGVWLCGQEESGTFTVAAGAGGHQTESVEVTVGHDECHVITEDVTFELDWSPD
jgi:hypothetical protein